MKLPQSNSKGWLSRECRLRAEGVRRAEPNRAVNVAEWARTAAANGDCQEAIDAKAFRGRGDLRELRQLVASLTDVEDRMEALSATSKGLADTRMYLVVHRRNSSGYTFLRWRERLGMNRHLPWADVEASIARHPPAQQRWCAGASELANQLNANHLVLRDRIRAVRDRLARSESHLYPRALPSEAG